MSAERLKFIKAEYFEEPTTISNVVDYLSSYMNVRGSESIDSSRTVLWSKFISCERNYFEQQCEAIILVGTNEVSVQVYRLGMDGKLCLLFSNSAIGRVDAGTVLPATSAPGQDGTSIDPYVKDRPILATVCESRLSFYSMVSGRTLKDLTHKTEFVDVCASASVVVASSRTQLLLISPIHLTALATLPNCRVSVAPWVPVVHCLSGHWLAYAEPSLNSALVSLGGDLSDPSEKPYALSLMEIKKRVTASSTTTEDGDHEGSNEAGIVSVVNVEGIVEHHCKGVTIVKDGRVLRELMVAHFIAHQWAPVARMTWDYTGTVLMTTCQQGIYCHVFRVVPHPCSANQAAVHHLYRLYRGETPRLITSMTISKDCRLAAASSDHGTVHVWAISSYGGPVCVRTHCQGHVVNRLSRLERSAGMQEHQVTRPSHMPMSQILTTSGPPNHSLHLICPRLPPFPYPCTVQSHTQLKPLSILPTNHRQIALVPHFSSDHALTHSPGTFSRTEWILLLSPDARLLQYALNFQPDQAQSLSSSNRTELDGPFLIEKRSYLQWRIPSPVSDCRYVCGAANPPTTTSASSQSRHTFVRTLRDPHTALLQSVAPDSSDFLEPTNEENVATPQCWFSNIDISSQISLTSSIRRQEKFSMSTYQGKEPMEARLEVIQKSPSISSQLSNLSWRGDDRCKDENASQPVRVPQSDQRIQICNSFCGSSISDSVPDCGDNVIFALAHAIQDDDCLFDDLEAMEHWEEPRSSYIESMTRDMSHVRLRRVSGSFSSDIGRLPQSSTSPPTHADIPEEMFSPTDDYDDDGEAAQRTKKGSRRPEKKKRKS